MNRYVLFAAATFVALAARTALADKTRLAVSSASAEVDSITLHYQPDGGVVAQVCGHANDTSGALAERDCDTTKTLSGANRTTALNMRSAALVLWKADHGL